MNEEAHESTLPSVYVETSIPSYLAARRVIARPAGRDQLVTCLWWNGHRKYFRAYASPEVVDEASAGDPVVAQRRIELVQQLRSLDSTDETEELSSRILARTGLPARARTDATHIAIAATHGIDYLLTWNCKHMANPHVIPKVIETCEDAGFRSPHICTPEQLIRRLRPPPPPSIT